MLKLEKGQILHLGSRCEKHLESLIKYGALRVALH